MIKGLVLCLVIAALSANSQQEIHYHYHYEGSGRKGGVRTLGKWCEDKAKTAYGLCMAASVFSLSGDSRRNKQAECTRRRDERVAVCKAADVASQVAPKRLLKETHFVFDASITPRELTRWCRAKAQTAFGLCMTGSIFSVNSENRQGKQTACRQKRDQALSACALADSQASGAHLLDEDDLTEEIAPVRTLGFWCESKAKIAYDGCIVEAKVHLDANTRNIETLKCEATKQGRLAVCHAEDLQHKLAPAGLIEETHFELDPNLTPRELTRWCRAKAQTAFGLCMTGSVFSVNSENRQNKQAACRQRRDQALSACALADSQASATHLLFDDEAANEVAPVHTLGLWCESKAKIAYDGCIVEAKLHVDEQIRERETRNCEHLKQARLEVCQREDLKHTLAPAGLIEETHFELDQNVTPRELTRWCRAKAQTAFGLCMTGSIFSTSSDSRQNKQANCRLARDQKLEACRIADEQAANNSVHHLADPVEQSADSLCRLNAVNELTSCLDQTNSLSTLAEQTNHRDTCITGHSARIAACDSDRALSQMRKLAKTPEEHLGFCNFSANTGDFWCRFWANLRGGEQKQARLDECKAKLAAKQADCLLKNAAPQTVIVNANAGHA